MLLNRDDFNITDPQLKDIEWAKRMVYFFTSNNTPLTFGKNVFELREWQNSQYSMDMFKHPYRHLLHKSEGGIIESKEEADKKLKIDFSRLGLFELTKNILGGEIDKDKINIDADCFDPTIQAKKEKEFDLFKNKKNIEAQLNKIYKSIGVEANYKVGNDGEFNSNIDQFESMGLDPSNPEDVEFFASTFYRHNIETYATQIINQTNDMNKLQEIQKLHINDIISLKCLALRTYYNTSTGLPSTRYVYPEHVSTVGGGTMNDKSDSVAIIETCNMTIGDFITEVGEENFTDKDYNDILLYATMGSSTVPMSTQFANGIDFSCNTVCPAGFCSWGQFFRFNINRGYIEWKTTDKNEVGRYFQKTMKTYYITGVGIPQKLFGFGYLNVQAREGYQSQYSQFSIGVYRVEGLSILEIAIPYFKEIIKCWLQFQYFLSIAKPAGKAYDINSLMRVAQILIDEGGGKNDIMSLMELFGKIPNMLYSLGDENSEISIGGNGVPFHELVNGIDKSAKEFLQAIEWCKLQVMEQTGLNNARIAQSPSPEEAYKKTQLVTNQSENATYYINSSIGNVYASSGYRSFSIIQNTIKHSLFGIDQIKQIFGEKITQAIKDMNVPLEYLGITVRKFLRDREREEVRMATWQAVERKEIPLQLAIQINDIDNFQKAAAVLTFHQERIRKQQQQLIQQQNEAAAALQAQKHKEEMELETLKGQFGLEKAKITAGGLREQAQISMAGKLQQQTERLNAQPATNEQRSQLKKSEDTHNAGLKITEKLVSNTNAPVAEK